MDEISQLSDEVDRLYLEAHAAMEKAREAERRLRALVQKRAGREFDVKEER